MEINILSHGFNADAESSLGSILISLLKDKAFHTFTGISAFTSYLGIKGLSKQIKDAKKYLSITIITGVDQKGTSKEALEEILALDVNSYVFYQPSISIFHPKMYLFEGSDKTILIIGSSNLTSSGLFSNVETSVQISADNNIESDRIIVDQVKGYFKGLFDFTDPNLKKLNREIITLLVNSKIVPTEEERKSAHDKVMNEEIRNNENKILKVFPKRTIAKIPTEFRRNRKLKTLPDKNLTSGKLIQTGREDMVWRSGKLTERDLNIPKGTTTNPTGSMLFKKGKTTGIDQRHFFRETVFAGLRWELDSNPKSSHLERASATFKIEIDGKTEGTFRLTITHNTKTNTRSYEQKNSMTSISWGKAKKIIARDDLIGKSVSLYKTNRVDRFVLRIQ